MKLKLLGFVGVILFSSFHSLVYGPEGGDEGHAPVEPEEVEPLHPGGVLRLGVPRELALHLE